MPDKFLKTALVFSRNFWWLSFLERSTVEILLKLSVYNAVFRSQFLYQFVANAHFLFPLKTSQKTLVFWCFQGGGKRKGALETNELISMSRKFNVSRISTGRWWIFKTFVWFLVAKMLNKGFGFFVNFAGWIPQFWDESVTFDI